MFLINFHFFLHYQDVSFSERRICQYRNTHVVHSIYGTEKINSFYNENRCFLSRILALRGMCNFPPGYKVQRWIPPTLDFYARKILGMTRAGREKICDEKVVTACDRAPKQSLMLISHLSFSELFLHVYSKFFKLSILLITG